MKKAIFILLLVLIIGKSLRADPVEISFLDNENAIKQTADFLLSSGCDENFVKSFRKVIDWYNSTPTDLDLKKFPRRENGFYSFQSVSDLFAALPRPLIYTSHQSELNCFETVILLTGNLIHTTLRPDGVSAGPFLPAITTTNHNVVTKPVATPQDAFAIMVPSWWAEASKPIFDGPMQDKRICLEAAFQSFYFLPRSTTRENFGGNLLQLLRAIWKREGIEFPHNMDMVICYDAVFDGEHGSSAVSSHAGMLFRNDEQYVFIEKLGTNAPYVRFDFRNKKDLFIWLRGELGPTMDKEDLLFATFNDSQIESLNEISR